MIMSSGRFSSGGGGGSNRDVVFTAKFQVDPKARQELEAFGKRIDDVARKAANIRLGASGGIAGSGRPGAGGRAGGASVTGPIVFDDAAESRRQAQFFDRAIREEQRILKQNAAERAKDLRMLKKDTKDVMEGMIGLSRAFVLFGVSSEENLEKAVRALAKFEGAIAGIKGGMKLSEGLGGLLGRGAPLVGMRAGAGGMGLGAAGVAAGVGVLGGGLAIADLIRFNTTGKIGAYSQGYSNWFTSLSRWGHSMGLTTEEQLANAGGATGPFARRAASDIRYERGAAALVGETGEQLKGSQQRLAIEERILGIMEREAATIREAVAAADRRLSSAAASFQSLSPMDRRAVLRLRDKFLDDPNSVSSRGLLALMGGNFVGQNEQGQIQDILRRRSGALLSRGFAGESEAKFRAAGESGLRLNEVQVQRELVVKLQTENLEAVQRLETAINRALEVGNEDLTRQVEEMERRINDRLRQIELQKKQQIDAAVSGYGGFYGN